MERKCDQFCRCREGNSTLPSRLQSRRIKRTPEEGRDQLLSVPHNRVGISTRHMSEIWERLIRSVRKTMKAVLGDPNAFGGLETLRTVFAKLSLSRTAVLLHQSATIQVTVNLLPQVIFCSNGKTLLYPLDVLNARIFTEGSNGEESNFWLIVFGKDGYESTSQLCKTRDVDTRERQLKDRRCSSYCG